MASISQSNDIDITVNDDNSVTLIAPNLVINSNYSEIEDLVEIRESRHNFQYRSLHINIHSIPCKFELLKDMIARLEAVNLEIDFIFLCETFLTDINKAKYPLPGFNDIICQNRKHKTKGGVAIYVNKKFTCKERPDLSPFHEGEFETIFAEVKNKNTTLIVGEVYRVPNTNEKVSIERFESTLLKVSEANSSTVIIGTDQNFDFMKINSHKTTSTLLNTFIMAGMIPTITKPTRITHTSTTLIDNIYVKSKQLSPIFSSVLHSVMSDHFPVLTCFGSEQKKNKSPLEFKIKPMNDDIITKIIVELNSLNWTYLNELDTNEAYSSFTTKLNDVINKYSLEKTVKIPYKRIAREPWMTPGLVKSCTIRDKLYKNSINKEKSHPLYIKYINYRNKLNSLKRFSRQKYYRELIDSYKNDMRKTWSVINGLIGRKNDKSSISEMFLLNGKLESDAAKISNGFCEFFTNVGKSCAAKIGPSKKTSQAYLGNSPHTNNMYMYPTDPEEIKKTIQHLKSKKSVGHDGISTKLLKNLSGAISLPLAIVMNKSLSEGIVPTDMKIAKVVPIYKSKDHQSFTNYRPISLLPATSKVMEKIVHKRLYGFLNINHILYNSQYGFRPKHSTSNAVSEFAYEILSAFDKNETTIATFLDLSKAFDTIDHDTLFMKLSYYGVRGAALDWFKSYFHNRKQYVHYNGKDSVLLDITCGVPQGSVLGPLLFILYTNDLPRVLQGAKCILFADDTTIYTSSPNQKQLYECMTRELNNLTDWFNANKLSLNTTKTNFIHFRKSYNVQILHEDLMVNNAIIERVTCTKFLGLYIDERLQWCEHIEYCRKKVASGVYALNMVKHSLTENTKRMMYFSLINPYLLYGNLLWGAAYQTHLQKLTTLQKRSLRIITNSKYNEHTGPLFKRLNILKLDDIHKTELAKFVFAVKTSSAPSPLSDIYLLNSRVHTHHTRQQEDVHVNKSKCDVVFRSFINKGPHYWSSLSPTIKESRTANCFRSRLHKYFVSTY